MEELEVLKIVQGNKCKICDQEGPLVVDHEHTSGIVRGLLCSRCNQGLGSFRDNPNYLSSAIAYLEKYNAYV